MKLQIRILSLNAAWLACALLSPAMAANAIVKTSTDSGSIELSNLDNEDATHEVLVAGSPGPVAAPGSGSAAPRNLAASAEGQGNADTGAYSPRPKRAELQAMAQAEAAQNAQLLPAQQQYQDLMLQQASFNGGPNGNLAPARKYLKVDRESYFNAVKN